jgi:hypothetical protein
MAKEGTYAQVRLPSGEVRKVSMNARATVGQVGNTDHENVRIGKAGRKRHMGIRPTVRGVVMNPVDHPHGGGEGKTSGGRHPVSPWGQKEGRTRHPNKESDKLIVRRRNAGGVPARKVKADEEAQFMNMPPMFVTREVSQPERSSEVREPQPWNARNMFVTLLVLSAEIPAMEGRVLHS